MQYRPAIPADADCVAALHARSWQETYRGMMPDAFLDDGVDAERLAQWRAEFAQSLPNRHIVVAEADGQLVGFACIVAGYDPVYGALLDNLHVSTAHKGRGIGRHLVTLAAKWVQQQQPDSSFYLWVYEKNH
ncbi:MAG: GNAT family N-acetyltransferase, partial [Bacteroidetes bacterium]|nr:GNAT family N-acetyltransferase [Fibrella sp.]